MKHAAMILLALVSISTQTLAQAHPMRDPFARPARPLAAAAPEAEAPQEAPQLRAVMATPGHALANINGQILAVGEWFGDYQLIKVEERAVTLVKHGAKSVLALSEASRK